MTEFPGSQWKDYELLDSGRGEKLERFGSVVMARPEPKALWDKSLSEAEWRRLSHYAFRLNGAQKTGAIEDRGTWERIKKADEQWYIRYAGKQDGLGFRLRLGLTAFKHVGVFPEQAPNWEFIYRSVRRLAGVAPETAATLGTLRGGTASAVGSSECETVLEGVLPSKP